MNLEERWTAAWADLGLEVPHGVLATLLAAYGEPARAYHTTRHLDECFRALDAARQMAELPGALAVALWFHDAVYDTRSFRNEEESARWAREVLDGARAPVAVQSAVETLILATRHGAYVQGEGALPDAALMVDVDLAILGALPTRFAEYEDEIRRELSWVPGVIFRRERTRVLRSFVERPSIYATEVFRSRLEEQARTNLLGALARLG